MVAYVTTSIAWLGEASKGPLLSQALLRGAGARDPRAGAWATGQ